MKFIEEENGKKYYLAEVGYIFKAKNKEQVLSEVIYLGKNDTIDNYEEVLMPTIEEV